MAACASRDALGAVEPTRAAVRLMGTFLIVRQTQAGRASPPAGMQRPYVATTAQVWALLDAFPVHIRSAVLLGALAGLRLAETCGLRVSDVDFMRGIIHPAVQYPAERLKSEVSRSSIPIPAELAAELSATVAAYRAETVLTNEIGRQFGPVDAGASPA